MRIGITTLWPSKLRFRTSSPSDLGTRPGSRPVLRRAGFAPGIGEAHKAQRVQTKALDDSYRLILTRRFQVWHEFGETLVCNRGER
jgi:hypothetical protein